MAFPVSATWRSVAHNGTVFCAVSSGASNTAATSTDGITWTARTLPATLDWRAITWNGTVFCAVAWGSTTSATSPDGITWTSRTMPSAANWSSIAWNGTVFCAVAWGGTSAATSPDGITWTARTLPSSINWTGIAWSSTAAVFCAVANGSNLGATSPDGITWTSRDIGYSAAWRAIAAGSSGFIAISSASDAARHSTDGITWYARYMPVSADWWHLAWDGSNFTAVAYGSANAATISPTGQTTTLRTLPASDSWYGITWGGSKYCAVASGTRSATSTDGITWIDALPAVTGISSAPTLLNVYESGASAAPTILTVSYPTGVSSAPTLLSMYGTGISAAPTLLGVIDLANQSNWSAMVVIDGVDVSTRLTGSITVDISEGAARVANCTLIPTSGTLEPLTYVGKTITIDHVTVAGGVGVPRRLFTGRVDTPIYDAVGGRLELSCTDDLQNRVAALDRAVLDAVTGGYYTDAVQGVLDDGWDYAQARMGTVAGHLDSDAYSGLRVTPWQDVPLWATYTDGHILDGSLRADPARRSGLINKVRATFEYRYARLRQRFASVGWGAPVNDITPAGFQYPDQSTVMGAVSGTGWAITQGVYFPAPAKIPFASGFVYPSPGSIDMAILKLTHRHAQTVTETYTLNVSAPESVSANGEIGYETRGALQSDFSGSAWETDFSMAPLLTDSIPETDHAPDATRADADYAIETLLAQAKTKILSTHRTARVHAAVLCQPGIDVDKFIAIDTAHVDASGKVADARHVLDLDSGSAITEFSIAVFGASGAGIIVPTPLAPPAAPDPAAAVQTWQAEIPAMQTSVAGQTPYQDGLMGWLVNPIKTITVHEIPDGAGGFVTESVENPSYTEAVYAVSGFRLSMPGVEDGDRTPITKTQSADYTVAIPLDTLQYTI